MKEEEAQTHAESQRLTHWRSADDTDHAAEQLNENYTARERPNGKGEEEEEEGEGGR